MYGTSKEDTLFLLCHENGKFDGGRPEVAEMGVSDFRRAERGEHGQTVQFLRSIKQSESGGEGLISGFFDSFN
jgi:hypothetical protein